MDYSALSVEEILHAILRWSALPGASRHHWGTDVDVYDAAAVPKGYQVQLTPEEVNPGGMFGPLHEWLDHAKMQFGFYRPYDEDRGGVSPERWHLSFGPCAKECYEALTLELLWVFLEGVELGWKDVVGGDMPGVFRG